VLDKKKKGKSTEKRMKPRTHLRTGERKERPVNPGGRKSLENKKGRSELGGGVERFCASEGVKSL